VLAGLGQRAATLGLIYAAERNVLLAVQIYQQTAGQPIAVPQEIFLNVHALVGVRLFAQERWRGDGAFDFQSHQWKGA
jgi:hypothetical protein